MCTKSGQRGYQVWPRLVTSTHAQGGQATTSAPLASTVRLFTRRSPKQGDKMLEGRTHWSDTLSPMMRQLGSVVDGSRAGPGEQQIVVLAKMHPAAPKYLVGQTQR
jgi:hypothetical protein